MTDNQYIKLAECRKPHGIKGGLSLNLENQEDSILKKGLKVQLKGLSPSSSIPSSGQEVKIKSITFGNKIICYFDEIQDRNASEAAIPFEINVSRDLFPEAADGEYYICDLVGLEVKLAEDQSSLGEVKSYFDNGFQTVLILLINDEEVELPFVDAFFPEVNIESGFITVILPEYT